MNFLKKYSNNTFAMGKGSNSKAAERTRVRDGSSHDARSDVSHEVMEKAHLDAQLEACLAMGCLTLPPKLQYHLNQREQAKREEEAKAEGGEAGSCRREEGSCQREGSRPAPRGAGTSVRTGTYRCCQEPRVPGDWPDP